jgi:hypothetical protein
LAFRSSAASAEGLTLFGTGEPGFHRKGVRRKVVGGGCDGKRVWYSSLVIGTVFLMMSATLLQQSSKKAAPVPPRGGFSFWSCGCFRGRVLLKEPLRVGAVDDVAPADPVCRELFPVD